MKRIEKLRKIALEETVNTDEFYYRFYKVFHEKSGEDEYTRYSKSYYSAFLKTIPSISEGELIVGKPADSMTENERKEWAQVYSKIKNKHHFEEEKVSWGQSSHMSVDYELILSIGLNGIIDKIDSYIKNCTPDKIPFYKTCRTCLEAVIMHSRNYASEALKLAETEKNPERKKELEQIAKICMNVPENPAKSFYEAIQSVHFVTYCLTLNPFYGIQLFQTGHPDRYLLKYYLEDIKNGKITKEFAQLLLDCFGIQMNMNVKKGFSVGYMVGGRDENGQIVANELTQMCVKVVDDIRLVYPAVGLCYTEGFPEKYLNHACEVLLKGCSHPAIFNDDIITKGLLSYGLPEKHARNYIHSTCVEITPVGASGVWVASPYINTAQLILDVLDREYENFDLFLKALMERLDKKIAEDFQYEENLRKQRYKNAIYPLLSCFVDDCLKRGIDIERGGAVYNWYMPSFIGMANLTDSIYAVKELVFDKKEFTIMEFKTILDSDFENNELLRQRILNSIPKYGNDIDEVDKYYGIITEHIVSECKKYKGFLPNSNNIPSMFCFKNHVRDGLVTGATPDGRKKGFPLGDGSGPAQGREINGPTASILSSTKWDHHKFIGGIAVNIKFSKCSLDEDSLNNMKSLIKTYLQRGGFEIQVNVTDKEMLKKAVDNPEKYRDLIVRIGGYSDYFTRCSKEMQQEIILRTEHGL